MFRNISPKAMRKKISDGEFTDQTSGLCPGYAQGNLVVLPRSHAFDFLLFASRNPKACPILEVIEDGKNLKETASGDLVTRVFPKYRVYRNGLLEEEVMDIDHLWQEDFVAFIIGCSFTFESALIDAGIPMKHINAKTNVAMYHTNIPCKPAGIFKGQVVVSMRPIKEKDILEVIRITSMYPKVHGAPVHIGSPELIGIKDLENPDFGVFQAVEKGELPVFWPCGVTPQGIAMTVKPPLMITHAPGHMLITDIKNECLKGEGHV